MAEQPAPQGAEEAPKGAQKDAAKRERQGRAPTLDFRGVKLTLPKKAPGTLAFDYAEVQENDALTSTIRMLRTILGEDQLAQVRAKLADDGDSMDHVVTTLDELLGNSLEKYGLGAGES